MATQRFAELERELTSYIPNLRAFANSLTRRSDLADDLVQETLIKGFQNMTQLAEGSNMKAWLFTILRNSYLSYLRKRKFEIEDADGVHAGSVAVGARQLSHMDLVDFDKALARLPADQREALILVGAEGFSYEDAALMCGCAVGTMKSRVNRARTKLAETLGLAAPATAAA